MNDHPRLAVVGLSPGGLPLAQGACRLGVPVVGFDTFTAAASRDLAEAQSCMDDISDDDVVLIMVLASRCSSTTAQVQLRACDTDLICVPTPPSADGNPDLDAQVAAAITVSSASSRGDLIVDESTTFPPTTEEAVAPTLDGSGLKAGADFHLAFDLACWDPYVDKSFAPEPLRREDALPRGKWGFDCMVLLQKHRALDTDSVVSWGVPVLDTRGVLPEATHP